MRVDMWQRRILATTVALVAALACHGAAAAASAGSWEVSSDGLVVVPEKGDFRRVRLQVIADRIVRVTATPQSSFSNLPDTLMIVAGPQEGNFEAEQHGDRVELRTGALAVTVSLSTGDVSFRDAQGRPLLAEVARTLAPVTADPGPVDDDSFAVRQTFGLERGESIYGLGQQQDGRVNYAGKNVELTTHNIEIAIPFLVSTGGYGMLWNNTSITRLGDPEPPKPLAAGFELYDADGVAGGLTARYFDGDRLILEQVEEDLDYQFLSRANVREVPFPDEVGDANDLRIEWEGSIVPRQGGEHELKMYSSGYASLSLDGEKLLDRWRMNWNPWYHNATVEMEAGREYPLRIDWRTQGGYFRLLHHAPPPPGDVDRLSIASESAKAVDYYFVAGKSMDEIIAGYRQLTGTATMLPKWAFGFWQSRERYMSQQELIAVLEEYRKRRIPIDNIVLDWFYWPENAWGSHEFNTRFFPDPAAMVERVHELDARIMVSVWPKFYPTTDNYKALDAMGCMFNKNIEEKNFDWVGPGYLNAFYDAFNPQCRELYWDQIRKKLNVYGFDAWWLDAVEPDMHSNLSYEKRKDLLTPNALGTGAEYFNAYATPHAETVYLGERKADADRRAFILTRSGFGGIQRTASAIWSGDIVSRWSDLKDQIAAGIGAGLAGMPYWTFDIGGFTPEDHYRFNGSTTVGHFSQMAPERQGDWQELNVRWFQFGALAPLFRSHGQNPYREIFNIADPGSVAYDSMVWYTNLRYRLMPYIYTLAADAHHRDGTMMRGLAMDFPGDLAARDVATQYMFGPALLVNPVFEPGARSREVYLPGEADWYDFHSGERHPGGRTIDAKAPLARMPLFVKAGSIVPVGPAIQHTGESLNAPMVLHVYAGADGSFELYEDDGLSYAYEKGRWSRIPLRYENGSGTLYIGEREGDFDGMAQERQISVRWFAGSTARPADFEAVPDVTRVYSGSPIEIERP